MTNMLNSNAMSTSGYQNERRNEMLTPSLSSAAYSIFHTLVSTDESVFTINNDDEIELALPLADYYEKSTVDSMINDVTTSVTTLTTTVSSNTNDISSLESDYSSLNTTVTGMGTDITTLQTTVGNMYTNTEIDSKITAVQNDVDDNADVIETLQTDVENMETDIDTLQTKVNTLENDTYLTLNDDNELEAEYPLADYYTDTEVDSKIATVQTSVTANTSDIATLQTTVAETASTLELVYERADTNMADIAELDEKVGLMYTDNEIDQMVAEVQTQVTNNTSDITTLQSSVSTNTSDIATVQTSVATNTSDITTLQTSVASNSSDLSLMSQIVADNYAEQGNLISDVQADVDTNTSSITTIQNSMVTASYAEQAFLLRWMPVTACNSFAVLNNSLYVPSDQDNSYIRFSNGSYVTTFVKARFVISTDLHLGTAITALSSNFMGIAFRVDLLTNYLTSTSDSIVVLGSKATMENLTSTSVQMYEFATNTENQDTGNYNDDYAKIHLYCVNDGYFTPTTDTTFTIEATVVIAIP